jgi:hypothetical protein
VRRWLGLEPKEAVEQTEGIKQTESVPQTETVKPRTVREALQQRHAHRQQQRRSGGMHV